MPELSINTCEVNELSCTHANIININNNTFIIENCNRNDSGILHLILDFNEISELDNILFKSLINLTFISLKNNKIRVIHNLLFRYNEKLRFINLCDNLITKFYINLETLPYLEFLNLEQNKLTTLNQSLFKHFIVKDNKPNNRTLRLNNNQFMCDCNMSWVTELGNISNINITLSDNDVCISYNITLTCWFDYREDICPLYNKSICHTGYIIYVLCRSI